MVDLRKIAVALCLLLCISQQIRADIESDLHVEPPPKLIPPGIASSEQTGHFEALKLFLKGQVLEKSERPAAALEAYEAAIKLDPQAAPLYRVTIPLCFEEERTLKGLEYCREALRLAPDDYALLILFAGELRKQGRFEEAVESLTRAVRLPEASENPQQSAQMNFSLGLLCEETQNYNEAALAYGRVVDSLEEIRASAGLPAVQSKHLKGEIAKTLERLGKALVNAEQYEEAVSAFHRAQDQDPSRAARLNFNLAETYFAQQAYDQAISTLSEYLRTQPPGAAGHELMIKILRGTGRENRIIPELERASNVDKFNRALKLVLAREYGNAGRFKLAEDIFLKAWNENPTEESFAGLGRLYAAQGRLLPYLNLINEELGKKPGPAAKIQLQVLTQDKSLLGETARAGMQSGDEGKALALNTRRALTALCRRAGLFREAEHYCRLCLPDEPRPADAYIELCRILNEAGKHNRLIAVCREALRQDLSVPREVFEFQLARGLSLVGDDSDAISLASLVAARQESGTDEHFQAVYVLATIYLRSNQLDDALRECEGLLAEFEEPNKQKQVHYLISGICTARDDHDRAETHLRKVLEFDPDDATANNDLGYIMADRGKSLEEAEKMVRKAIEIDRMEKSAHPGAAESVEDNAAYIDSLGWVLYRRGKLNEARVELEKAARISQDKDPVIYDHLGEVYLELGEVELGIAAWEKAVSLYAKDRRVEKAARRQELMGRLKALQRQLSRRNE